MVGWLHGNCECCGVTCSDTCTIGGQPRGSVCLTHTWTDMDTTKNLFGQSWTNGETKTYCPNVQHNCVSGNSYENWKWIGTGGDHFNMTAVVGFGSQKHVIAIGRASYTTFLYLRRGTGGTAQSSDKVSTHNLGVLSVDISQAFISSEFFGQITWTDGITTSWTQNGANWNYCSNT